MLAKLGLNQFSSDDLRLLEIYASIAAQAMANADATEQLHAQSEALSRQLNNQRELLRVTESILTTLDTQALLEEIAERLQDARPGRQHRRRRPRPARAELRPIFARGVHAAQYIPRGARRRGRERRGRAHRRGQLVQDELGDSAVAPLRRPRRRPAR